VASDRPLHRKLAKLAVAAVLGRRRAHAQDAWPGLTIKRAGKNPGEVRWRGRPVVPLLPFAAFSERVGDEVVIVGSGPSLREQRRASLPGTVCTLLNGAVALVPEIGAPFAIAVEDERFVWRHMALLREHVAREVLCLLSVSVLRALCEVDRFWLTGRRVVLIDDILKPYGGRRRAVDDPALNDHVRRGDAAAVSLDPGEGVVPAGTVAFSALQFALASQPKRIGFAGIDLSNADVARFYEEAGNVAASGIAGAQGRILSHFALAARLAVEREIALECYSPVSALLALGMPYVPRLEVSWVTEESI
jgi:Kdo-III transferase WaaZ